MIGTPDDAIRKIQELVDQSGGFGTFLLFGHDWARPEATKRSFELFAQYVMPHFQDQLAWPAKLVRMGHRQRWRVRRPRGQRDHAGDRRPRGRASRRPESPAARSSRAAADRARPRARRGDGASSGARSWRDRSRHHATTGCGGGPRTTPRAGHNRAPRSRRPCTTNARHSAGGMVRVVRPTSIGTERPRVITRAMPASHNMRSIVATGNRPTCSACARRGSVPTPCSNTSTSSTTETCGRCRRRDPPRGRAHRPGTIRRARRRAAAGACARHRHRARSASPTPAPRSRSRRLRRRAARRSPTMPSRVGDTCSRRRSCRAHASAAPPSPSMASVTCCTRSRSCFGATASAASTATTRSAASASRSDRASPPARSPGHARARSCRSRTLPTSRAGAPGGAPISIAAVAAPCVIRHFSRSQAARADEPLGQPFAAPLGARTRSSQACSKRSIAARIRAMSTGDSDAATLSTASSSTANGSNICSYRRG